MLYFANPCGPKVLAAMRDGTLGYIDTPAQGNRRPTDVIWCADNGAYSNRWDESRWWSFLRRNAHDTAACAFAVAPDVVGDAVATAARSRPWLDPIRSLGYPAAYVAQDGATPEHLPWGDFDALFVGGTTEWKLGPTAADVIRAGRESGKWVHMGRVNSRKRFNYARSLGCDSADGTYLVFGPDKNLPKLLSWIEG